MQNKKITDYKLAKLIGVHPSTIKNWKDGAVPSLELAVKVAKALSVPLDSLINE